MHLTSDLIHLIASLVSGKNIPNSTSFINPYLFIHSVPDSLRRAPTSQTFLLVHLTCQLLLTLLKAILVAPRGDHPTAHGALKFPSLSCHRSQVCVVVTAALAVTFWLHFATFESTLGRRRTWRWAGWQWSIFWHHLYEINIKRYQGSEMCPNMTK